MCTDTEFRCPGDVCIPRSRLCDGRDDCEDGRDEGRHGNCTGTGNDSNIQCVCVNVGI